MGIDVRTNSAWHDVSSASARIGGSWRTIKEGYQRRNGAWEQVWPGYKDYGGDSVRLDTNGYIDRYGYYATVGNGTPTHSGTEGRTCNYRASFGINSSGYRYHFFSTAEPFDARGYNYMAFPMNIGISTDENATGNLHSFYIYPLVSFASAPDASTSDAVTNIEGYEYQNVNLAYDQSYSALACIDLTNCDVTDLYLRVGYVYYSSWNSSSFVTYGYMSMNDGESDYTGIYLYKNKSDCPFSFSDYKWYSGWVLEY